MPGSRGGRVRIPLSHPSLLKNSNFLNLHNEITKNMPWSPPADLNIRLTHFPKEKFSASVHVSAMLSLFDLELVWNKSYGIHRLCSDF